MCWSLPLRCGQSFALVLLSCRSVSLCVVRVLGQWCVRLRALRRVRSLLCELNPETTFHPNEQFHPNGFYQHRLNMFYVFDLNDGLDAEFGVRSGNGICGILSGFGYNAKYAIIKCRHRANSRHFTIMTKLFETWANMYIAHNARLPKCHLDCPLNSYRQSTNLHSHMYALALTFLKSSKLAIG